MAALSPTPQVDLSDYQQAVASAPLPQGERAPAEFMSTFGQGTFNLVRRTERLGLDTFGLDPGDPNVVENPFKPEARLSSEDANARYGGDGLIRFNAPVSDRAAAQQLAQARQQQAQDEIFSNTRPTPLTDFGARLAGGFFDPSNLGLMFATGPAGEFASTALGLRGAAEGVAVTSKLGKLANAGGGLGRTFLDGAVVNTPFVAANAGLMHLEGQDYDLGDALRDITYGAVFHTGLNLLGKGFTAAQARIGKPTSAAFGEGFDEAAPTTAPPPLDLAQDLVPSRSVPDAVSALSPTARLGAVMRAFDKFADDEPIDIGRSVQRELDGPDIGRLDEGSAEPAIGSFRQTGEDVALTPRGDSFPVRTGLAELSDLTTPLDHNLGANPAYPQELRMWGDDSADQQARRVQLARGLDPKAAIDAAPIVSPAGVVEHGGAGVEALRGSPETAARYRAALEARGLDTSGMTAPVAVRMRAQALTGSQRAALSREMAAAPREPEAEPAPKFAAAELNPARQIYANLNERFARGAPETFDLRAPGKAAETGPAPPPLIDLRPDAEPEAPGAEKPPSGEGAAPKADAPTVLTGDQIIAADPELKALAEDTDRYLAAHGLALTVEPKEDPNTIAKAIRAAAMCVAEAADEIF